VIYRQDDCLPFIGELIDHAGRRGYEKLVQRVKHSPLGDERLEDGKYSASFYRSKYLGDYKWKCEEVLKPAISKLVGEQVVDLDLRIHKMVSGDYLRAHVDGKLGSYGFTVTLSRDWKLDWGGLLIALHDEPVVLCPKFNQLVVLDSKTPHFVTEVSKHALEERLTMVGFAKV
jgi:Rps23 Pro-64 3,4-dihydroxylase Tpa1-like proline 4-hydroxylase